MKKWKMIKNIQVKALTMRRQKFTKSRNSRGFLNRTNISYFSYIDFILSPIFTLSYANFFQKYLDYRTKITPLFLATLSNSMIKLGADVSIDLYRGHHDLWQPYTSVNLSVSTKNQQQHVIYPNSWLFDNVIYRLSKCNPLQSTTYSIVHYCSSDTVFLTVRDDKHSITHGGNPREGTARRAHRVKYIESTGIGVRRE